MFQQLCRPSSGCTFSYFKANYTINNVFCFCQRVTVELKNYFEIKDATSNNHLNDNHTVFPNGIFDTILKTYHP